MTLHDEIFAVAAQDVVEYIDGETFILRPTSGEPKSLTGVPTEEVAVRNKDTGIVHQYTRRLTVSLTVLDGMQPRLDMEVTVGGLDYSIENISSNGSSVLFHLVRYVVSEPSRPNYRRPTY